MKMVCQISEGKKSNHGLGQLGKIVASLPFSFYQGKSQVQTKFGFFFFFYNEEPEENLSS